MRNTNHVRIVLFYDFSEFSSYHTGHVSISYEYVCLMSGQILQRLFTRFDFSRIARGFNFFDQLTKPRPGEEATI